MRKNDRPYNCLLIETHYDYYICVPFRTEIHYEYAYRFHTSKRSRQHCSGLDYTKSVIINNSKYISSQNALVDQDEFKETMRNLSLITKKAVQFVEDYVACQHNVLSMHPAEYRRRYAYTTLQYFHKELGI